jgi:hypothetical protein
MFFFKGRVIGTTVGFQQKEKLNKLVKAMIKNAKECWNQRTKLEKSPESKKKTIKF